MRTISYRVEDLRSAVIGIGFAGENEHTQVRIDCAGVFAEYPTAVPAMAIVPPAGEAYPKTVERSGDTVIWTVTDSDLTAEGSGEMQLSFVVGEMVAKSYIAQICVKRSIIATGEEPEPIEDWLTEANATLASIPGTIDAAVDEALAEAKASGEFDGPAGADGKDGAPGADGFSPVVSVSEISGGHSVSVTDAGGTETFNVMDGHDGAAGQNGQPGADGFSPSASVSKSGSTATITITDKNGTTTAQISDGTGADIIDDIAGSGDTDKTWSADKLSGLNSALSAKYTKPNDGIPSTDLASGVQTSLGKADSAYQKPSSGIPASDIASGVIPSVPVTDVQVNGTSILSGGVADIPAMSDTTYGVGKARSSNGLYIGSQGHLTIYNATDAEIKAGENAYHPIVPLRQEKSVFYGLAKASGDTSQSSSSNAVGVYTADALVKIQKMLGIYEAPWELIREDTVTNATEADIDITVDGNGNAFELTDVVLWFELPSDENASSKGEYGRLRFYYDTSNAIITENGAMSRTASGGAVGCSSIIEQKKGLVFAQRVGQTSNTNTGAVGYRYYSTINNYNGVFMPTSYPLLFSKIRISAVTGKAHYKLYGKRKWN